MLSAEKNKLLTEVEPGAPMGDLLRRYWQPIAGVSEFDENPVKSVRFFGEDLVLYKDLAGNFGLVDRHCPHRRADLSYGFVEQEGIRCSYHGWLIGADGKLIEAPYDDLVNPGSGLKAKCRTPAYPVRPLAGMLWAYMGPDPAPELPVWEPFTWENGFVEVVGVHIPCNWLQCQENSIDPVHFEWMHDNWSVRLAGELGPYAPRHVKLAFEEFEYGLVYKRIREGMTEADPRWQVGRVALWPNGFFLGTHFEWRVPVDDESTLCMSWFFTRRPNDLGPYKQERIPAWYGPMTGEDGRWITSHIINQDAIGWAGQGRIADRTKETLGAGDRGVTMMRQRLLRDLDAIAVGGDPSGIIRDPAVAGFVELPTPTRELFRDGLPLAECRTDPIFSGRFAGNRWVYGQPEGVRQEFLEAMGIANEEQVAE
ncbi:MAG: hypothetical protein RLZ98_1463 [Pseudomonadota bacterium]|jgi:5,5'-dehydrodivanillate O-demethylase